MPLAHPGYGPSAGCVALISFVHGCPRLLSAQNSGFRWTVYVVMAIVERACGAAAN
jgi:hypothetical protein